LRNPEIINQIEPMQIKNIIRPSLPHIVAVIIFFIITAVYFYPVLEGKVLHTNDGTVAKDASNEIRDFRAQYGKEPLWTNSMFSGMPAYLISTRFPGNLMRYADALLRIMKLPIASIFLTMLGFYILLLIFRIKPWLALAGAIAYGLSTYFFFILAAGHNTKAMAIAYMAPMIGGIYYTYRYNVIKGALLTTFFLSLEIIANHPQILYYSFLCLLVFVVVELISSVKQKRFIDFIKRSAILIIPVTLAVGMNFASLSTTYEYGKYSIRGKSDLVTPDSKVSSGLDMAYATQWSYGIDETLTLLIPDFKGGANIPFKRDSKTVTALRANNAGQYASSFTKYWGTQPWTDGPVYVGAIVVFLFILGLVIIKGPEKWWLLAATLLSIMLAWGKNFMPLTNLFMDYFPGYNKFRAVTMTLVIAEFCMPLLAILALRDIFEGITSKKDFLRGMKIAVGVTGGLAFIFLLIPGLAGSFISPAEQSGQLPAWLTSALMSDRKTFLRTDALRSLFFILAGASVLLGFYYQKIKKEHAIALLGLLFLIDMFTVDKRYMNADKFVTPAVAQRSSAMSFADNIILKDTTDYRVLNLTVSPFQDATTSLYHRSIGGYHGAKLERYNELIDSVLYPEIMRFGTLAQNIKSMDDLTPILKNLPGLNMLNTRYIILNPGGMPLINTEALGNAWFVDTILFAENANEELALINKIHPSSQAVVDIKFKEQILASEYSVNINDSIYLTSYKPNELIYKYSAGSDRFVVFSEIYYPEGWKASIDGTEKDFFRTDWVLRGMIVPGGGEHEIRFVFEPASYYTGIKISYASSMIFILMLAGFIVNEVLKKKKIRKDGPSL
jgi:hypothetical protein